MVKIVLSEIAARIRADATEFQRSIQAALRAKREQGTPIKALMEEDGISNASVFRSLH